MLKSALLVRIANYLFVASIFILVLSILPYQYSNLIGTIEYIGTAIALIVGWTGFYFGTILPRLKEPILEFSELSEEENIQKSIPTESEKDAKNSWFIRLRVRNKGQTTAKNCVGRLLKVLQKVDNYPPTRPVKKFDPLPLYWARQGEPEQFRPIDIQPNGDSFFLDIAQVKQKEDVLSIRAVIPKGHRLIIDPNLPDNRDEDLPPGTFYLKIAVYSENVSIKPTWYKVTWRNDYSIDPPCEICREPPPQTA